MHIKLRGYDADFINDYLSGKDYDLMVGKDCAGNEIFTGDIVTNVESGGDYVAQMSLDLYFLPFDENISNFKLKERKQQCKQFISE